MAFFDDLGKKISQVGQSTIQKTKEMADVAKINSMISEENKKLSNSYYQLGRLYAQLHSTDYEQAFADWIGAIRYSEERIQQLQKQIQSIKGLARCTQCGSEVPSSAAFCSVCGAKMPSTETEALQDMVQCPICGQAVALGTKFCTNCGNPLSYVENMQTCPSCGAQLSAELNYCTECGAKLSHLE